jgi:imidazolonepropionase-like amidohydrolase
MSWWIDGALVVDGTGRDPAPTGVLIENGRITQLGNDRPASADVIDANGLTLTPGLIDAHVHIGLSSDINASVRYELSVAEIAADMFNNLSTTLDGGFTTVRDTGGIDGGISRAVARGLIRGPRVIPAGPIQCQRGGHGHLGAPWEPTELWSGHGIAGLRDLALLSSGPDEMRANVRESFRRGAEFIKLCVTGGVVSMHDQLSDTQLTVEEIAVAVSEAKARGTYVTVHAHNNAGLRNAIEAGVECVEHGSQIDDEMAALMKQRGVAHVPTLLVVEDLLKDASATGLDASIADRVGVAWQGQLDAIRASADAGVLLGSGSDLIGPHQLGRGRELTLRAQAQSPMAALVSATRDNARILRISDEVGTVEVGKRADLALWAANPIDNADVFADRDAVAVVLQSGRVVRDVRQA